MAASLVVVTVFAGISAPAYSQPSTPCGPGPCVEVGLEDGAQLGLQFADDADHFVYCAEGSTVTLDFLAKFTKGTTCGTCEHDPRAVSWSVEGATDYTVTSSNQYLVVNHAEATIELGAAGDTITVTCTVSGTDTSGECYEDKSGDMDEHDGDHGGDSASCTIKLWRMDLETNADLDPVLEYPHCVSVFADSVTTSATIVGSSALAYRWRSWLDGSIHKEVANSSSSWTGKLIDFTSIQSRATVINQCDITKTDLVERGVYINATIRRQDWTTEVQFAGTNTNWLSHDPDAFPQINWQWHLVGTPPRLEFPVYGRNANAREHYDNEFAAFAVPYYNNNTGHFASDYADFSSKVTEITSGPHEDYIYTSDPNMYEIRRQVLSNYWISPAAGHPATPALDNHGNPYSNWIAVFEAELGADCKCTNPSTHGGTGSGAFYQANLFHEGRGNPNSPNNRLLGHQSRVEDGFATGDPILYDPIYKSDLLYADDEDDLRAMVEVARSSASVKLGLLSGALHGYVHNHPERHNYKGDVFVYEPPPSGWVPKGKDTF